MKNTVLRKKPNMGNPYAWVDGAGVVPTKPRRRSLRYREQLVAMMLALVIGVGFPTVALSVEDVSSSMIIASSLVTTQDTPPDKPSGDGKPGGDNPPDKPSGGGETGGGSESSVILTGAYPYTSETNTLANATLTSTTSDQNVILAQTNAYVTVSNCVLNKSGDMSSEDNSNFYAVNAVVAAKTAAMICISHSTLNSEANGANCLFASGVGSTIYAYKSNLTSTKNSSRGLDATYEGKVIGAKLTINTEGSHCAALATDRGNGSISVTDASLTTAGNGSPLIYSTGVIEVNSVTGTATSAQIAGIEGLSEIRITNSDLTGSGEKASEPVANGVIIYQSNSGDSADGTATFEVSDSTLTSSITNGAMFYITHSDAIITVQNTELTFDSSVNDLIKAAGNNGSNGWGKVGSNGAGVTFTAINQTLKGNISVDGISSNDLYLVNSTYTGTIVKDTAYTGDGGANVFIDASSTWTVTSNCTLKILTAADGAKIVDSNANAVSIVGTDGTVYVSGTSNPKITVSNYVEGNFIATNITDFTISRNAFNAMYGTSQSEEDEGDDSSSTGSKTYYFKPHAPTNGVVGVSYNGTKIFPDMDHKYWLDDYWTNGVTVTVDFSSNTTSGYFFPDGSSITSLVLTITENRIDFYPPAGFESAYLAQARSESTYYPTLKEAIDSGKKKIMLNDSFTLSETLTITNSIILNLNTNVITLASTLTNAFHFTAGGTVSNGTITSSLTSNVANSVLMRFTDCKATLKNLIVNGRGYETVIAHGSTKDLAKKYAKDASDTITCDGLILTGNGNLFSIDYTNATLTNGCSFTVDGAFASFDNTSAAAVSCNGNGAVMITDGTYTSPKVLQVGDLGGTIIVNGGTFNGQIYSWMVVDAHTDLEKYTAYKATFTLNVGTYTDAIIAFADADSRSLDMFTKGDEVAIEVPAGYAWVNNVLVGKAITPGVASESYDDAQSATNAATKINTDKASTIAVPTGVKSTAKETYLSKVEATVTSDNRIVVNLTTVAEAEIQSAIDEAATNETVVVSLTSTNMSATVTLATTMPGLYYWINGGTDVSAITTAGTGVLSTNGGAIELSKPTLDATKNRAFFTVAAGVSAPVQSNDD